MRVVVTGGAGYIGSHTARLLAGSGHDVLVYDNLSRGHRRAAELAVGPGRLAEGDLLDEDRLDHALLAHRAEALVHFAAYALVGESVSNPGLYWRNNVGGTLALLRCMARQKVGHIVFSSTCAVYGEPGGADIVESLPKGPVNPYGETKLASEWALAAHARAHGIGATALRYFNAAGADPDGLLGEDH
ncbi:MAG: NAD-dependent epimerase/dehydratase family protein, partial [Planctomycetota bacterium]